MATLGGGPRNLGPHFLARPFLGPLTRVLGLTLDLKVPPRRAKEAKRGPRRDKTAAKSATGCLRWLTGMACERVRS